MMRKVIDNILLMPYFRNCQAVSGAVHNISSHEDAVENVFCEAGLTKVEDHNTKGFKKTRDLWIKDPTACDMENGTYISQPCGPQNSPDFIVKVDDKVYFIECKSSAQTYPTFNSGKPNPAYIYVFCSSKTNSTTVFRGDHISTIEQRRLMAEYEEKINNIVNELNIKLEECDDNNRGLALYHRAMWTQKGGAEKTDCFNHSERLLCEQRVLNEL
jgi:hypothetical protein